MNNLDRVIFAISTGLGAHDTRTRNRPRHKPQTAKFHSELSQNQMCAAGWLLLLFGERERKDLGRIILNAMTHVHLARVSRDELQEATDEAILECQTKYTRRMRRLAKDAPDDTPDKIANRIRLLIKDNAVNRARDLFERNKSNLDAYLEPLQKRFYELEFGGKTPSQRKSSVSREFQNEPQHISIQQDQEFKRHSEKAQVVRDILTGKTTGAVSAVLSDISVNPKRAFSFLEFFREFLTVESEPQLFSAVQQVAPSHRFVILAQLPWVNTQILARALEEALQTLPNTFVQEAVLRMMSRHLFAPQKNDAQRPLFEKLSLLTASLSEYGQDRLVASAHKQGLRVLGSRADSSVFLIDQDYRKSALHKADGVEAALTDRAKIWLQEQACNPNGVLVLSPHSHDLCKAELRLQVALARMGKPVKTIVNTVDKSGEAVVPMDPFETALFDRHDITQLGRPASKHNAFSGQYLGHLRAGEVLQIYFDAMAVPGKRAVAPWYVRPAKLSAFPAQLAISSEASICFAATWMDRNGGQVIDIVPMPPPPKLGSAKVQSLWFTQQIAHMSRLFAYDRKMAFGREWIVRHGGLRPWHDVLPMDAWVQSDAVRESKLSWLNDCDENRIAIYSETETVSFGRLGHLVLRMANMLLHFQDTAPDHTDPNASFRDQHRVLCLLPASTALIAAQLGATAAGSLLCVGLPEDPDDKLAERLNAFDPDLVIVTASTWARLLSSYPELEHRNALIIGDTCDQDDLSAFLESFPQAPALPPFDPGRPAYVVYTSGSTGEPKGVVLAAGMAARMRVFDYKEPQTVFTIVRWDSATALELLGGFAEGHAVVLPQIESSSNLKQLCDYIVTKSVTVLSAPCSIIHGLLKSPGFSQDNLPEMVGFFPWGEQIRTNLMNELLERFPNADLNVSYGATEFIEISGAKIGADEVSNYEGSPSGLPLPGIRAVNTKGDPLQPGEIGRIEAIGYDRTLGTFKDLIAGAPAFDPVKDPILLDDWVKVLPDGSLDLLGRVDDVVNIHGRRLALTDVAEAAERIEGVARVFMASIVLRGSDAVAMAVETDRKDLIALEGEIRDVVTRKLFAGAVPQKLIHLEELPHLPSGKLDRKKLRSMLADSAPEDIGTAEPEPETSTEDETLLSPMLTLLREFASQEGLVPHSRFDPDGIHPFLDSILSLILMLSVEKRFGTMPDVRIFDEQDVSSWRDLAERLDTNPLK